MPDADVPAEALALVERAAAAVRGELGEEVDAYPGRSSPERALADGSVKLTVTVGGGA